MTNAYVDTIETLIVTAIPVLAILTVFSWREARRLWPYRLPLVIALTNTLVGACATWLAFATVYRERVGPIPEEFGSLNATAILVLILVPWATTTYLVWLEVRRRR